ncbi:PTS sugar transporter subunit IIA [Salinithrix halophila]|uniref:PTS sugar transporter subunit IIA n=1 Tax=Salinithrix halophila TaxID=1485204 RepID=A0ABV8JEI2_9BACL
MKLSDLLTEDVMVLDLQGSSQEAVMDELLATLDKAGFLSDRNTYKKDLYERESYGSTGFGFGIAIPHGKSSGVRELGIAFGRQPAGIDWDSLDGEPVNLVFMIAAPVGQAGDQHLHILQALSRKLLDDAFRAALLKADTKGKVKELMDTL